MTKSEAGKLGGLATSAKFNKPLFCDHCGQVLPLTWYQINGQKGGKKGHGGLVTKHKYGIGHYKRIGGIGGRGNKGGRKKGTAMPAQYDMKINELRGS